MPMHKAAILSRMTRLSLFAPTSTPASYRGRHRIPGSERIFRHTGRRRAVAAYVGDLRCGASVIGTVGNRQGDGVVEGKSSSVLPVTLRSDGQCVRVLVTVRPDAAPPAKVDAVDSHNSPKSDDPPKETRLASHDHGAQVVFLQEEQPRGFQARIKEAFELMASWRNKRART